MPTYVLDTSAIMCVLFQEEGSEQVVEVLEASRDGGGELSGTVLVPSIALINGGRVLAAPPP